MNTNLCKDCGHDEDCHDTFHGECDSCPCRVFVPRDDSPDRQASESAGAGEGISRNADHVNSPEAPRSIAYGEQEPLETITVTQAEADHIMWSIGVWGGQLQKLINRRKDDGLNDMRRGRLAELRVLSNKIVQQRREARNGQ